MQALRLPARQGFFWLKQSFMLYRRNPIQLTAVASTYLMLLLLFNLVPLIGQIVLPLFMPMLSVLVANACRAVDRGQLVTFTILREEIGTQRKQLIRLGSLQLALTMVILLITQLLDDGPPKVVAAEGASAEALAAALPIMLRTFVMTLPLMMAYWFAPLLSAWDGVPAAKSLFFSFIAVCRNWRAFLLFFLAATLFGVLIPGLIVELPGLLVPGLRDILAKVMPLLQVFILLPIMLAATYVSYKEVFVPIERDND